MRSESDSCYQLFATPTHSWAAPRESFRSARADAALGWSPLASARSGSLPGRASCWLCLHGLLLLQSRTSESPTSGGGQRFQFRSTWILNAENWNWSQPKTSPIRIRHRHRHRWRRSLSISPRYSLVAAGRPQSCFCCARQCASPAGSCWLGSCPPSSSWLDSR